VKALTAAEVEGSTTMVLAKLDPPAATGQQVTTAIMRTLNLGDSVYMILRPRADGDKTAELSK